MAAPRQQLAGIRWWVEDGVAWITLTRARRGNRIDQATAQALCTAAEEIEFDDSVAVVMLRGSGASFCLGVEGGGDWEWQQDWVAAIGALTRPVVAALNGDAVAEGCELALACDIRLMAASAHLKLPQVQQRRLPRHGATQRLPRLIGRMRAMDMLLSGRPVGAREAAHLGLVSRVVPAARFDAVVRQEMRALKQKGPIALRLAKEAVNTGIDLTLGQGIRLEQDLYVLLQTTVDRAEGVRAFLAGRRPRFRGE